MFSPQVEKADCVAAGLLKGNKCQLKFQGFNLIFAENKSFFLKPFKKVTVKFSMQCKKPINPFL
jgi:hypothetical protein